MIRAKLRRQPPDSKKKPSREVGVIHPEPYRILRANYYTQQERCLPDGHMTPLGLATSAKYSP